MGLAAGPNDAVPESGSPHGRQPPGAACCELWGVLNVTTDSFSDGGAYLSFDAALARGKALLTEGADVLDVGGASSRPRGQTYGEGAPDVPAVVEAARVQPVVRALAGELGARVSIDTVQPEVARSALAAGACIVNDVSCGAHPELFAVAAEHGAEYVLMHTRGRGEVQPPNTLYADVVADVLSELLAAVERAERYGIARARLWIDPGIGFAKTAEQSLLLLAHTAELVASGLRVLVGPSRKGFIAQTAPLPSGEKPGPLQREAGTAAALTVAVLGGAHAVRVHDVASGRQAVRVAEALRAAGAARGPAAAPPR
ncbi:MAG TPA: dihydropteroate synthase, partial [Polyangiales bacterium]|nr:dihydropteroate synthase [Polyangiales bacterium]